jgi:hypothetical protein
MRFTLKFALTIRSPTVRAYRATWPAKRLKMLAGAIIIVESLVGQDRVAMAISSI